MSSRDERWQLVLGADADEDAPELDGDLAGMDRTLGALYGEGAGLGRSTLRVSRWLGDIRRYFPASTVQLLQHDALERLELATLLKEPELLEQLEPDVHLVAALLSLRGVLPARTRDTARRVVAGVVRALEARLREPLRAAVRGAVQRASRTRRPRPGDIDWDRTIRANLVHWLPSQRALVPERLVGFGRRKTALRDVVLLVDQSGSMASSVVYASVFAAVLASVRALRTRVVLFDTELADVSELVAAPIELLFAAQLGGGTDIDQALAYAEGLVARPRDTIVVLVSDLYEGGDARSLVARMARLHAAGVTGVCLLALSDDGAPAYHRELAAQAAAVGWPAFACTPDRFPELMAAAIERRPLRG